MKKDTHTPTRKDAARSAERRLDNNEPDSFPPEGTDESTLRDSGDRSLSEKERLKATREFIKDKTGL